MRMTSTSRRRSYRWGIAATGNIANALAKDFALLDGLRFQVDEVEACLDAGATQRAVMPWAETLRLAALMDDIRALIGMRYDADALDAGRA
jgi:hypothetical protein